MQRAHSVVQLKRVAAEARRISGIASTPATDRQGDVLVPSGAVFKLPLPLLLGHDHGAPLGEVIDARVTPQGIYIVAQLAAEGTSERIDEAWRLIRAGLIKGLSVGFIGLESSALPNGGRKFTKWEVIELSAVVVPANAEAGILEVKRLDAHAVRRGPLTWENATAEDVKRAWECWDGMLPMTAEQMGLLMEDGSGNRRMIPPAAERAYKEQRQRDLVTEQAVQRAKVMAEALEPVIRAHTGKEVASLNRRIAAMEAEIRAGHERLTRIEKKQL